MNLKPFVNDKYLYDDFLAELLARISLVRTKMEQTDNEKELFRCQGEIRALRSLMRLREKVNNG